MITGGGETSARHYFQQNASDIGTPKCEAQGGLYEQYDTSLVPSRPHHPQVTANAQGDPYNDFEKFEILHLKTFFQAFYKQFQCNFEILRAWGSKKYFFFFKK